MSIRIVELNLRTRYYIIRRFDDDYVAFEQDKGSANYLQTRWQYYPTARLHELATITFNNETVADFAIDKNNPERYLIITERYNDGY